MKIRWVLRGIPVVVAAIAALGACSLLVPLDDQQCTTSDDCTARGSAFAGATCVNNVCVDSDAGTGGGDWSCLGLPSETTDPNMPVSVTLKVFDALSPITTSGPQGGSDFNVLSYVPVSGISVEGCERLDPTCTKPVTGVDVTNDAGTATFTVSDSFTGFFHFTGPNYLPSALFMGNLLPDASTFSPPVALLATKQTVLLASVLHVTMELGPEAGVGHAFFQVYDCADQHAAGVSFSIPIEAGSNEVQFYSVDDFPSTTATSTDPIGAGGAVNVPVGALTVNATLASTGQSIGSVNAFIAPGTTSFIWIRVRTH